MQIESYNLRVYGLLLNPNSEILVTDELRNGYKMTKFPGGGHEVGESLAETLIREWKEELDREISVGDLFYVNDFLQISAFNPKDQIISFYYHVSPMGELPIRTVERRYDFPSGTQNAQTFRWVKLQDLHPNGFTFPIDKVVVEKFREMYL